MKCLNAPQTWLTGSLLLATSLPLCAANDVALEPPKPPEKNRFGISYRAGFNFTVDYKNVGNVAKPPAGRDPGPATGDGVDRFYDDGYNRVDISGNKDGLTWFWGFKHASQVQENDTIVMHSTTVSAVRSGTYDSDPQHGFELTYDRELGRWGKDQKNSWGWEAAFGWTDIDIHDKRPLAGGVRTISDAYGLEGVNPGTEHTGTYEGPDTLIESNPSRTITTDPNGSRVTGLRQFEGDMFSLRLGPYIDVPIDKKWTLSFSAGLAVGVIDGEYSFHQRVTTVGGSILQTGSGNNADVMVGGYLSASIRYAIDDRWGVFVSGQYMGLADRYSATAKGQKIELEMERTALFAVGVSYSF